MIKITDAMINRRLAEFEGWWGDGKNIIIADSTFIFKNSEGDIFHSFYNYTHSLDACVGLVEKLGGGIQLFFNHPTCRHEAEVLDKETEKVVYIVKDKSPSRALSLALFHADCKEFETPKMRLEHAATVLPKRAACAAVLASSASFLRFALS